MYMSIKSSSRTSYFAGHNPNFMQMQGEDCHTSFGLMKGDPLTSPLLHTMHPMKVANIGLKDSPITRPFHMAPLKNPTPKVKHQILAPCCFLNVTAAVHSSISRCCCFVLTRRAKTLPHRSIPPSFQQISCHSLHGSQTTLLLCSISCTRRRDLASA
jgi:hypothetical protein